MKGFGLSYTSFQYSKVRVSKTDEFEYIISVNIQNTGHIDGHEVAQLYLSLPKSANSAPKHLKGFERVFIKTGETVKVNFALDYDSFKYWKEISSTEGSWDVAPGTYEVCIGASSECVETKSFILE